MLDFLPRVWGYGIKQGIVLCLALTEFNIYRRKSFLSMDIYLSIYSTWNETKWGNADLTQKKVIIRKSQFYTFLYFFSLSSSTSLSLSLFFLHHFTASGLLIRFCLIYMTLFYFLVTHWDGKCVHAGWRPLCLPFAFSRSLWNEISTRKG